MQNKPFPINALNLTEFKPEMLLGLDIQFFAGTQNKVKFGLTNVHYAVATDSGTAITYGTPVRIPGAVSISLSPNGELTEFYADNTAYWSAEINNGYDGDLSIADLPESFAKDVLGVTVSADGVQIESAKDKGNRFAMTFEVDGDVSGRRYVLYYCAATRPNIESQTKEATVTPQPSSLTFNARPHPYNSKIKANTIGTTSEAIYNAWNNDIYEPA